MKKLLTILAAIGLTATSSSMVVACGSSSTSKNNKVFDDIDWGNGSEQIITLADGTTIRVGDLMKSHKSDLDAYLLNDVNKLVANKYAEDYNDTTINGNSNLGLLSESNSYALQGDKSYNGYNDEISNYSETSLATDLYRSYVSSLLPSSTPLDGQFWKESFGQLNPIYYGNTFHLNGSYAVWYTPDNGENFVRWTTLSETNASAKDSSKTFYDDLNNKKFLPTADILNGNNFYLVADKDIPTGYTSHRIDDESKIQMTKDVFLKETDNHKIIARSLSGQKALLLRFQKHIQLDSNSKSSMQNALVMEYAKNNLYKLQSAPKDGATAYEQAANKSLYIDTSSTIAKDIQSWPSSSKDLVTSKYKMVWNVSLPKDKAKDVQTVIDGLVKKNVLNNKLKTTDYQLIDNDKAKTVIDFVKALTDKGGTNQSQNGSDPYFGISGYQGIVKDKKLVDGGTLNISDDAVNKIDSVEGLGILYNGINAGDAKEYTFEDKNKPADLNDYIIVMPLYLMDLLRDGKDNAPVKDAASNTLNDIATNKWIELNPQFDKDEWNSSWTFSGPDKFTVDSNNPDKLPTKTSLLTKDGKTYLFLSDADKSVSLTATKDGKSATINVTAADHSKDTSGFGIKGIYSNTDEKHKDAWKYNGQEINYAIHLGVDRNSPTSYLDSWTSKDFKDENVDDIANLTNQSKTELINSLLAFSAKDDSSLQEETKNSIYRNYISLDDIHYKGLYDDLSKYLKEDDSTDESD